MLATVENMRRCRDGGISNVVTYSAATGEEYSANPGDYWYMDTGVPLLDEEGNPMVLVTVSVERVLLEEVL